MRQVISETLLNAGEEQMPDNELPFKESLDEITDLKTWTETIESFAVPPNVAANMRRLGVTRAHQDH